MIICRRCGHANEGSETFCASCGTFLKWDGEEVDRTGTDPPPPDGPRGDKTELPGALATPDGPGPVQPSPDPSASVVCLVCATPNTPDRTFCRSCGERLVPEPVERPVVVEPVHPRRGGNWALVAAALVVGAAAVVSVVAFGAQEEKSVLSSPAASDSPVPAETAVPTSPPTPSPALTPAPPEPIQLDIVVVRASSSLKGPPGEPDRYAPNQAIDDSLTSSWQEGASKEAGQWIEVDVAAADLHHIVLLNGWQWKPDAFYANRRLRDIQVLVDGTEAAKATLDDSFDPQTVVLGGVPGGVIRIVIVTTYDSEARPDFSKKSPFDDAALSEIQVFGTPGQ